MAEEAPRVFDHPTGRWLRTGHCSRCGECCLGDDPGRTCAHLFTPEEQAGRTIEGKCPLLRLDGDRYGCAGHDGHPFYRTGCDEHPRCPDDMAQTPSCTYRFTRLAWRDA